MIPKRDRLDYQPYFRVLADRLALKDWTVIIKDEAPDDGDANASVSVTYGRKRMRIYLSEGFLKDDECDQRHTACHELIHCHLDAYGRLAEGAATDARPLRMLMEIAVDALADAIAPLMVLPSSVLDRTDSEKSPLHRP